MSKLTQAEVEALARVGVSEDVLNEGGTMQVNDEMVKRFKEAWDEADVEGDAGNRVRRGLSAALSVVDESELAEVIHAAICGEKCPDDPARVDWRAARAVAEYLRGGR